jgi:hypothetical protein
MTIASVDPAPAAEFAVCSHQVRRASRTAGGAASLPAAAPTIAISASGVGAPAADWLSSQWWFPLAFACSFVLAGIAVAYIGWHFEPVSPNPWSRWVALAFGALFGLGGVFMLLVVVPPLLRPPIEPGEHDWRHDYDWHATTRRQADDPVPGPLSWLRQLALMLVVGLLYALLHLPLILASEHVQSTLSGFGVAFDLPGGGPWLIVMVVFDLVLLLIIGAAVYIAFQRLRFGRPELHLATFPAWIGGDLRVEVRLPRALQASGPVQVGLRCIDHSIPVTASSDGAFATAYEETFELDTTGARIDVLRLAFVLPDDVPGTQLQDTPQVHWRLAIRIPVRGPDLTVEFRLPVYAAPSPAAANGPVDR